MHNVIWIIAVLIFVFSLGLVAGSEAVNDDMIRRCQKKHDVLKCEIVAMPAQEHQDDNQ